MPRKKIITVEMPAMRRLFHKGNQSIFLLHSYLPGKSRAGDVVYSTMEKPTFSNTPAA